MTALIPSHDSKPFRFSQYTVAELRECADRFKTDFYERQICERRDWTPAVLDWFFNAAAPGLLVNCSPCVGKGTSEFLVDLCHSTYPLHVADECRLAYYDSAFEVGPRIRFALECEWANYSDLPRWTADVLDDACKLAHLRADAKAMVFCSHSSHRDHHETIVSRLCRLRETSGDASPWLCIDVPWSSQCGLGGRVRADLFE